MTTRPDRTPRAVLFDLDDTLYDHLHSARSGLAKMQSRHAEMSSAPIRELEDRYSEALESVHVRLMRGEVSQREARTIRMRQFFGSFGIEVTDDQAMEAYTQFRSDYDSVCQVVAGTHKLLRRLQAMGIRLGVITNNLVAEQIPKLRQLELTDYFEVVTISEEVGVPKPDPQIFHVALERFDLPKEDLVVVGDSLSSDIAGAVGIGMRCVWLKRRPELPNTAPAGVSTIEGDFADVENSLEIILGA